MPRCAFLTMDSLDDFFTYDELLEEPLAERGWTVDMVSWRDQTADWDRYDAVVIRSPWDYQDDPEAFMKVLETIDASSARLENKLEIVRWNISKTYLRDMEQQGITIVPTIWHEMWADMADPSALFGELQTEEIIIKPVVSANADHTYRLNRQALVENLSALQTTFAGRPFMIQPFVNSIVTEGEYSLFYFGKEYSHAILKKPGVGDFRVQEEHGGTLHAIEADEALLAAGRKCMGQITPLPLYSRIDFVRTDNDSYALMELELIEPSLYFNMDPDSPERFARVFAEWMK